VFGAGPAGLATAIRLARSGAAVVVLDRHRPEGSPWVGESLAGAVREPLVELGAWDRFLAAGHVPSYAVLAAWGAPEPRESACIFRPHGHGWHVDRRRFDADLRLVAEEAGCGFRRSGSPVRLRRADAGWRVELDGEVVRARFLVDATGRCCAVGRRLGARRRRFDSLVAHVAHVPRNPDPSFANALVVQSLPQGWWYAAPVPGGHVLVHLTDRDLVDPALRRAGMRAVAAHSALIETGASPAEAGWLAVGDALAAHDPLCGWGVCGALGGGILAGDAIAALLRGSGPSRIDEYGRHAISRYDRYLEGLARHYSLERRWPSAPFWHRRLGTGAHA
jgi:flavin-dependent dehydrogenase